MNGVESLMGIRVKSAGGEMKRKGSMRWLEYISVAEAFVIRLAGLNLITIFIIKAIVHEVRH